MSALKAHQVNAFLAKPDLDAGIILAFGSDTGLVHERAQQLVRHYAGPDPDPMAGISLDMSTIAAEPERLAVEARTPSLFGGNRVIRIREATNALVPALEELLLNWPEATVIVEGANLTPRDKLRVLAEKSPLARTLPCYADNERDLADLIKRSFTQAGIKIDSEVVSTLGDLLGNDREITRREIEKLILFASESKELTADNVLELSGDNTMLAMDLIVDSTATGHAVRLEAALSRALTAGIDPNRIMAVALSHFVMLRSLRAQMQSGQSATEVMKSARPRPHFSRTRSIEQQLRLWNDAALGKASERIYGATREMRKTGRMPDTLARRALLAICMTAAQR